MCLRGVECEVGVNEGCEAPVLLHRPVATHRRALQPSQTNTHRRQGRAGEDGHVSRDVSFRREEVDVRQIYIHIHYI